MISKPNLTWARSTAGVAVMAAAAGIAWGATGSASAHPKPHPTMHTLHLTTRQTQEKIIHGTDLTADDDSQHGRITGYDVTSCRVDFKTHIAACDVVLARPGGLLYVRARVNVSSGSGSGSVQGGTRHFAHARGTANVNGAHVTIRWHR